MIKYSIIKRVKYLIEKASSLISPKISDIPLIDAIFSERKEIAKFLIEKGVDLEKMDFDGNMALLAAVSSPNCEEIIELLIEKGVNTHERNRRGNTAFLEAAERGHKKTVKLLIEKGADLTERGKWSDTALLKAANKGHEKTVKLLIEKGADLKERDQYGDTALLGASARGHEKTVKLLIEKGADLNERNEKGYTALMLAIMQGHKKVVELLIEEGANLNEKNNQGQIALGLAITYGYPEIVNIIKNAQAFSIEKDLEKQKEILKCVQDEKQALNLLIKYPDRADLFFQDDRMKKFIGIQLPKNSALLIDLIEKLSPTGVVVKQEGHLLDLIHLIVEAKFGRLDRLISWFYPQQYGEYQIKLYCNQLIEQLKERNTPESNFVLAEIFLQGLFSQKRDIQKAADFFKKVNQTSSVELYLKAQHELAEIYTNEAGIDNSYTKIAKEYFENIIKTGENYLAQHPDNPNVKEIKKQVESASGTLELMILSNPNQLGFFSGNKEEKFSSKTKLDEFTL